MTRSTNDRVVKRNFERTRLPAPPTSESVINVNTPHELKKGIPQYPPMWVWMVVLIVSVLGLIIMLFFLGVRSIRGGGFIFLPMMAMSMFMMFRGGAGHGDDKQSTPKLDNLRAEYLNNLDIARDKIHDAQEAQALEIAWHHPDPRALATLVGTARQWERLANSQGLGDRGNFGHVRLGLGASLTAAQLNLPDDIPPPDLRETVSTVAIRDFGSTHQLITGVPRPLALFDQPIHAFVTGPDDRLTTTAMLRAMIAQAATFHGPDELLIAVVTDAMAQWEPLKWAPHCADPEFLDKSGPARLIYPTVAAFMARFGDDLAERPDHKALASSSPAPAARRILVVVDHADADPSPITGPNGKDGVAVLHAAAEASSLAAAHDDRVYYLTDGALMRYYTPIKDWETA